MGKDASTRRRILNKLLAIDRIGKKLNLERFGCWPSRRDGEHPILFAHFLTLLKSRLRSHVSIFANGGMLSPHANGDEIPSTAKRFFP
jgi:hypothetical protein